MMKVTLLASLLVLFSTFAFANNFSQPNYHCSPTEKIFRFGGPEFQVLYQAPDVYRAKDLDGEVYRLVRQPDGSYEEVNPYYHEVGAKFVIQNGVAELFLTTRNHQQQRQTYRFACSEI